jgi:hypothetical protein
VTARSSAPHLVGVEAPSDAVLVVAKHERPSHTSAKRHLAVGKSGKRAVDVVGDRVVGVDHHCPVHELTVDTNAGLDKQTIVVAWGRGYVCTREGER